MDERVVQLRIGLMVLITLIITVFLLILFGGERNLFQVFQPTKVYYVEFSEAPGVTENTAVQKSGIRIGQVTRVQLADEVEGRQLGPDVGVVVTIEIQGRRKIFTDETCVIQRNLLGDAVLEFVRTARGEPPRKERPRAEGPPAPKDQAREPVPPGTWLKGDIQADPIQVVGNLEANLSRAISSVGSTSDEIRVLVEKVSNFLGTEEELQTKQGRLAVMMDQSLATMQKFEQLADNANQLIGDEDIKQRVKNALAQAPDVLEQARSTLGRMRQSLDGMDETVRLVNRNLQNVESFTGRLGDKGSAMIDRLDRGAEELELLLREMHKLTRALNSREGSLGQFIHDPQLYENLNEAAANLEDLTVQLRPIVRDARTISDRMARHPGSIIRDAIRPGAGTKGVPSLSELQGTSRPSQPSGYPRLFSPR